MQNSRNDQNSYGMLQKFNLEKHMIFSQSAKPQTFKHISQLAMIYFEIATLAYYVLYNIGILGRV